MKHIFPGFLFAMAPTTEIQSGQRLRMANHYEATVLSMALLRGDRLSDDQKGQIVNRALAATSPEEFRNPGTISAAAVGQLHQFLIQTVEAGKPRNDFGADAARAAQAAGGSDGQRGAGFGYIDALRGSSARYRDLPAGDSVKSTSPSGSGGAVTPEFARSFAGTGMVGGTLRTFAEVGLDRGTFNEFRQEGFSKAQIKDNAQDTKALGWKGKEDLSIAQHALPEARKAAIAVEQAKTPDDLVKAQEREAEVAKKVDAMPDSDPRKHGTQRFFKHVIEKSRHAERHKAIGASAERDDAAAAKDQAGPAKALHAASQTQDGLMAREAKKQTSSVRTAAVAGFEVEPETPVPAKPLPLKVAAAKPAAPAPAG